MSKDEALKQAIKRFHYWPHDLHTRGQVLDLLAALGVKGAKA